MYPPPPVITTFESAAMRRTVTRFVTERPGALPDAVREAVSAPRTGRRKVEPVETIGFTRLPRMIAWGFRQGSCMPNAHNPIPGSVTKGSVTKGRVTKGRVTKGRVAKHSAIKAPIVSRGSALLFALLVGIIGLFSQSALADRVVWKKTKLEEIGKAWKLNLEIHL